MERAVNKFIETVNKMCEVSKNQEVKDVFSRASSRLMAVSKFDAEDEQKKETVSAIIQTVCEFVETNQLMLGDESDGSGVELEVFAEYLSYFTDTNDYTNIPANVVSRYSVWFINKFLCETGVRVFIQDLFTDSFSTHERIMRYCHTWNLSITFSLEDSLFGYSISDQAGFWKSESQEPHYELQLILEHALRTIEAYIWNTREEVLESEYIPVLVSDLATILSATDCLDLTSPDMPEIMDSFQRLLEAKKYIRNDLTTNEYCVIQDHRQPYMAPETIECLSDNTTTDVEIYNYAFRIRRRSIKDNITPVCITLYCCDGDGNDFTVSVGDNSIPAAMRTIMTVITSKSIKQDAK